MRYPGVLRRCCAYDTFFTALQQQRDGLIAIGDTTDARQQYAICVENADYPVALERRTISQVFPDPSAHVQHLVRVIDESGADYRYPATYCIPVDLPHVTATAVSRAA